MKKYTSILQQETEKLGKKQTYKMPESKQKNKDWIRLMNLF